MPHKGKKTNYLPSCYICNTTFQYSDLISVHRSEQKTLFHATCPECQTSSFFAFLAVYPELISVGVMTDLGKSEALEKLKNGKISTEEVLKVYQSLK